MPRDIWEEIFLHCLPVSPDPDTPCYNRKSPTSIHLTAPLILLQVCRAWRTVALSLPDLWTSCPSLFATGKHSLLSSPFVGDLPSDDCWRLTRNEEIMQDLLKMLEVAPRLSSFSVSRLSDLNVSETTTVAIPWTQLVRLDLGFIPSVSAWSTPRRPIVLPALTSLELHIRAGELAALIDWAVFPALKNFTLYLQDAYDNHAQWPQASFMDFLSRSKCALARLELHDTGVQATQFIDCLQHESVRGIAELVIHDNATGRGTRLSHRSLCSCLRWRTAPRLDADVGECLLPALKALDLGKGCWTCPNGLLSEMIESRWRTTAHGVARLERVHIDLHLLEDVYGPDHMRLEKLREEGMKVRLTYFHD
ncbi:hypothetical protein B0H13DRAFT_2356019 [Mycena leptocephala]|nr:hypothetical protein B0H13DRAFT_2356019 [Mycena leptocephala]